MFEDLNVLFQANTAKKLNKYIIAIEITMKQSHFCTHKQMYAVW